MTPLFASKQAPDKAFERLYKAHVQDVYRYSLMVLRNKADAEDVAQTTFLKAYRAFQRGERPRYPRQWLITIAHNTCRTHLRDGKRRPQEVELEEQISSAATVSADDDGVDAKELVRALGALSFNQRAALVMRELEGRSYSEIAEVLSVSSSAVETLLFRARRAVREQLEGTLTCGEAERALSLQLDGRLPAGEKGRLRAHLRECKECATVARRQRARQAVLRSLGPLPLPASLASWGGGTVGIGIGAKAAAIVAAGFAAAGAGYEAAEAVREPAAHDRSTKTAAVAQGPVSAPAFFVQRRAASAPAASAAARSAARPARAERTHSRSENRTATRARAGTQPAGAAATSSPDAPASAPDPVPGVKLPVAVPTVTTPSVTPPVAVPVPTPPAVSVPVTPPPPPPVPTVPEVPSPPPIPVPEVPSTPLVP